MPAPRPFRFAVQLSAPLSGMTWQDSARTVEDLGYSTLFMPDHLDDQLAPLPALAVAAQATTTLKVGALVLCNDYRHPVVMAKEIATLDVLTGGRVELGLGAGWMRSDYTQAGLTYDPPAARIDRFEEAVDLVYRLFGPTPVDHQGTNYQVSSLVGRPAPATSGGPPLIIGGGGKRMLGVAARRADIVGINPNMRAGEVGHDAVADATAAATDRKVAWVREAAGDRFDSIELQILTFFCAVTPDAHGLAAQLAPGMGIDPVDALACPSVLVGTEEEIADTLLERRERWGFSYVVVHGGEVQALAPVVARLAGK